MNNAHGKNPARTTYSMQYLDLQDSNSFNAMRPLAQLLVMKVNRFYDRTKQKAIYLSARIVCELVGISNKHTALSLLKEAVHHGFFRKVSNGYLGASGKGVAATYQLTYEKFMGKPATLDFKRWNGAPYWTSPKPPKRTGKKTESHVSGIHTPCIGDTQSHVSREYRANGKARKIDTSKKRPPMYRGSTHLEGSPSSTVAQPVRAAAGAGKAEPSVRPAEAAPDDVFAAARRLFDKT